MTKDSWGAYECLSCFDINSENNSVCFDVRITGEAKQLISCPCCGADCSLREQWDALEGGYGSRAEADFRIAELEKELRQYQKKDQQ